MTMRELRILLLLTVPALGACTVNAYCEGEQNYQKAQAVPPLNGVEGLKLPESASALKIPPPPASPVRYGEHVRNKDGDDVIQCLDKPPEMPQPAQPKAEEKKPA